MELSLRRKIHVRVLYLITSGAMSLKLSFLLVPKYGYIAGAFTNLVSYTSVLVLMKVVSRRFFVGKFPFKFLTKTSCTSEVMGVAEAI